MKHPPRIFVSVTMTDVLLRLVLPPPFVIYANESSVVARVPVRGNAILARGLIFANALELAVKTWQGN